MYNPSIRFFSLILCCAHPELSVLLFRLSQLLEHLLHNTATFLELQYLHNRNHKLTVYIVGATEIVL